MPSNVPAMVSLLPDNVAVPEPDPATVARMAREGEDVVIAILGEGAMARVTERTEGDSPLVVSLKAQSRQAAELLGAKEVRHFGLPDNRFDTVPLLDVVRIVEGLLEELAPQAVYTHHGGDLNVDHQTVFRSVLTATRPLPGHGVSEVYAYEVNSSTEWAFQRLEPVFRPSLFVDVSETIDVKVRALQAYGDEVRPFPHPRSPEAVRAAAQRWGSAVGVGAAEAFEPIRIVR